MFPCCCVCCVVGGDAPPPLSPCWLLPALCCLAFWRGGAAPCLCAALPARPAVLCGVLFLLVAFVPLLLSALCWQCCCPPPPAPSSPWWFVLVFARPPVCFWFLFVSSFVFRVPVPCLAVFLPMLWSAFWSVCCRAISCWRAGAVWLVGSLCRLAACRPVCCLVRGCFFFIPVCRAFWCVAARRCCPLCVVRCEGPLSSPAVWYVAGLRPVVLW